MKRVIILLVLVSALFLSACESEIMVYDEYLTDENCDAMIPCDEGYICAAISGLTDGALCVLPDPCDWYCEDECLIQESYPPTYVCS